MVRAYESIIRVHLLPFFGKLALSEITAGKLQEYRIQRQKAAGERLGRPVARATMHDDMVAIRQVLKTALWHGWLQSLPDMSVPYRTAGKIAHRA